MWAPQRLELLGGDDQDTPQVARAVAVAALQADAGLLLVGERSRIPEGVAAMFVCGSVDIAGPIVGETKERTDGLRPLGQPHK